MRPGGSRLTRRLWLGAGAVCFALGWVGVVLPLMPGVPFFIAAAFCFARGKPEWERRMLDHPRLGPPLRDWRDRQAIARHAKLAALGAMAVGGVIVWVLVGWPWAAVSIGVLAVVAVWIATRAE